METKEKTTRAKRSTERSNFGKNLRAMRDAHNLSRPELSSAIEIKSHSITAWEEGRAECSLAQLVKIAKFFKVTTDNLLA